MTGVVPHNRYTVSRCVPRDSGKVVSKASPAVARYHFQTKGCTPPIAVEFNCPRVTTIGKPGVPRITGGVVPERISPA